MANWISSKLRAAETILQQIDQQAAESLRKNEKPLADDLNVDTPTKTGGSVPLKDQLKKKTVENSDYRGKLTSDPSFNILNNTSNSNDGDKNKKNNNIIINRDKEIVGTQKPKPTLTDSDWTQLLSAPNQATTSTASRGNGFPGVRGLRKDGRRQGSASSTSSLSVLEVKKNQKTGSNNVLKSGRKASVGEGSKLNGKVSDGEESGLSFSDSARRSPTVELKSDVKILEGRGLDYRDMGFITSAETKDKGNEENGGHFDSKELSLEGSLQSVKKNDGGSNKKIGGENVGDRLRSTDRGNHESSEASRSSTSEDLKRSFTSVSDGSSESDSGSSSDSESEREKEERRKKREKILAEKAAAKAVEAIKERENLVARLEGEKQSLEKILEEQVKQQAQEASKLQMTMMETMEAADLEKQKHNNTRMEVFARLAKLEAANADLAKSLATVQWNLEVEVNGVAELRQQVELKEVNHEELRRKISDAHQAKISLNKVAAPKGVELEREILEAEYAFVTDKVGRLQDKAQKLEANIEMTRKEGRRNRGRKKNKGKNGKMLRALTLRRSLQSLHHNHLKPLISTAIPQNPLNPLSPARACSSLSSPSASSSASELRKYLGYTALVLFSAAATYYSFPFPENAKHKKAQIFRYAPLPEELHTVSNWSGTHEVQTRVFHQPETLEELEKVVKDAHEKKTRIRPVGSGLSPNGIGLSRAGMVNLALMDKVLEVDKEKKRVRVQAGIRVQELVDGIKEHGLTLQNFASIREQQIGGILQVGAHGTGAKLPPMDEQVISMKLVTPAKGTIEISKEKDPELFYLARCGLGGLGVVAEVTIQCVERQELVEHTSVSNMEEIKKNHKKLLSENKHVKYLYIPYSDTVVVVTCNPVSKWKGPPKFKPKYSSDEAIQHVRDLYKECLQKCSVVPVKNDVDINELSFTELRDKLLALDPLDKDHVVKVNQAEAEFWRKSEGYRVGWSDEILGFDCGGQQWVSETCFPVGTLSKPSLKDLEYIEDVKQLIEKNEVPAPAPIEQRWTACTKSPMSPASSTKDDDIFSWVGIIMYLPTTDARQRKEITEEFFHYRRLTQVQLWDKYSAYEHWAKIEVPKDKEELASLQARLRKRFPVDAYNKARKELDPSRILSNNKLEKLFPLSDTI